MAVNPAGTHDSGPAALAGQQLADVQGQVHAGASRITLPLGVDELSAPDQQAIYATAGSTYIQQEVDFFASSVGQVVKPVTMDSSAVSADSYGDKAVYAGTTLQLSGAGPKVMPRAAGTCVGILRRTVNLRWGDEDVGLVVGGHVNQSRLTDAGVYGAALPAGVVTSLNGLGVFVMTTDA